MKLVAFGIDPGACTGYAVVSWTDGIWQVVSSGAMREEPALAACSLATLVYKARSRGAEIVACEEPPYAHDNPRTLMALHQRVGAYRLALGWWEVRMVNTQRAKAAVGVAHGGKAAVLFAVNALCRSRLREEDEADAAAVAVCAIKEELEGLRREKNHDGRAVEGNREQSP